MLNWSTCFTRAQKHLKAADAAFLLKDMKTGITELTKAQQWISEAVRVIWEDKQ